MQSGVRGSENTPLLHPDTDDSGLTRVTSDKGCFSATKSDGSRRTPQELAEKLHAAGELIAAQLVPPPTPTLVEKRGFVNWM